MHAAVVGRIEMPMPIVPVCGTRTSVRACCRRGTAASAARARWSRPRGLLAEQVERRALQHRRPHAERREQAERDDRLARRLSSRMVAATSSSRRSGFGSPIGSRGTRGRNGCRVSSARSSGRRLTGTVARMVRLFTSSPQSSRNKTPTKAQQQAPPSSVPSRSRCPMHALRRSNSSWSGLQTVRSSLT